MKLYLVFGVVVLLLVAAELFFRWRRSKSFTQRDIHLVTVQWHSILEHSGREPRFALIEADKLLDFVLKRKGFVGSLGDKLKKAEPLFSDIDGVWAAHKLRNRAAHEVGFHVSENDLHHALKIFKKALWDMGIKL
ncbi:MAG: hypothetical protein UY05_C0049G0009 [Candidatus Peregrinibacteria bacterium GW2011_GWA2_47_7]|nr:MAG: hypothetical protein UY05_C0049G0009 [Candidatus Peregrinibacteria bacterium GW2011_GWA2_47_7]